jgi:3-hydroxyisobutyrate dehydrogenase
MSSSSVGMVGLGLLGSSLAERLMKSGFTVFGYDVDQNCRDQFQKNGGTAVDSVADLLKPECRIVFSLPTSDISLKVAEEILSSEIKPEIIIDTTTGDPAQMIQIGDLLNEKRISYLDATVGGSSEQAKSGEIILMIGGDKTVFESCNDVWECWSKNYSHIGPSGSGAKMKLVMNLVLGLNRAVLAEGLSFAESLNLSKETTLEVLKSSPAFSGVMETKGKKMIENSFDPPQARLAQHWKDVRLILKLAEENSQKTPFTKLHESILDQLCNSGLADVDNSAVIKFFEKKD